MSMIIGLIEDLRRVKRHIDPLEKSMFVCSTVESMKIIDAAINTIESLSAKLKDICSDGEWIYCADKDRLPEESGEYQTVSNCKEVFVKLNFDVHDGIWFDNGGQCHEVIAWWRVYPYEV